MPLECVETGLGILLPAVQTVFTGRPKEYLPRALDLPLLEVAEKNKGLRIQLPLSSIPGCVLSYTSWVTLSKLLNLSEHMFLICKVRLIISKSWFIVKIVDNVRKTQSVLSKYRRRVINIFFFFIFYSGENFVIFNLRTDRTIMRFTIHSRLCTFDNTIMCLTIIRSCFLLWEVGGILASPSSYSTFVN